MPQEQKKDSFYKGQKYLIIGFLCLFCICILAQVKSPLVHADTLIASAQQTNTTPQKSKKAGVDNKDAKKLPDKTIKALNAFLDNEIKDGKREKSNSIDPCATAGVAKSDLIP